jgi:hypothetical protein
VGQALLVAALPGGEAGAVALGVGEHPVRRGGGVVDQHTAGFDRGSDAALDHLGRDAQVEVPALAGYVVRLGGLEPDRRAPSRGVVELELTPGLDRVVVEQGRPERPDLPLVRRWCAPDAV